MSALAKPGQDFPGLGVGLVIRRADGKVLVCRRLKAPEAGQSEVPIVLLTHMAAESVITGAVDEITAFEEVRAEVALLRVETFE